MGDIGSYVNLPPGFRFCPTDEELVLHFLYPKAFLLPCHPNIIPDIDLQLHNPWDFNGSIALSSGNMYYFFSKVTDQYRVTANGYWKDLEKDEAIVASGNQVGVKKCLVFCVGGEESPVSTETDWVMEEFSLICDNIINYGLSSINNSTAPACKRRRKKKSDCKWVLCRVHERKGSNSNAGNSGQTFTDQDDNGTELSCLDEMFFSLLDDDLDEITTMQH